MKFDYIVGNPPYQGNTSTAGKGSKKIYFQITGKMIEMFNCQLSFITPRPILMPGVMNKKKYFNFLYNNIYYIEDVDKYFKESTNAIMWIARKKERKKIIYNNKVIKDIYLCYSDNVKKFYPIYLKLSCRHNNKPKFKIKPSHENYGLGLMSKHISGNGKNKVIHQREGDGPGNRLIKFTDYKTLPNKIEKIIVPYSSKWFTPFISDYYITEFFGVITEEMYPKSQWENIISYLNTPTIRMFIEGIAKMYNSNYFNGIWQLTEVDFTKPWTDEMVRKEFDI